MIVVRGSWFVARTQQGQTSGRSLQVAEKAFKFKAIC